MKTWKRRWFILTDNCLYYFEYTTVSGVAWGVLSWGRGGGWIRPSARLPAWHRPGAASRRGGRILVTAGVQDAALGAQHQLPVQGVSGQGWWQHPALSGAWGWGGPARS